MLMSATGCVEAGLTFASVHDSYWTHACDVEIMNEVLRDQFIALHSNNIMKNLEREFMERYRDYLYPVTLVVANPGEPVLEGMIAWDDERLRRKNAKVESPRSRARAAASAAAASEDGFVADPVAPKDEPFVNAAKAKSDANVFHFGDEEDDEHDLSSVVIEEDEAELEAEAKALGKALRSKGGKRKAVNKLFHSWDPISFPPLPDRGDFDVRRVAESDYFFS